MTGKATRFLVGVGFLMAAGVLVPVVWALEKVLPRKA
jgi:hypothetical protein